MTHKDLPELPKPEGVFWTDHGYGREPIPRATFQYPADQMHAYGRKCYDLGARSTAAQPAGWLDDWEWEQLAWQLCAEEHGEDACNELIWEGGPIPEPWGDRWLKYEGEAKRMIALVRQYAPPAASGDSTPPSEPPDVFKPLGRCTCAGPDGPCEACESNREAYEEWLAERREAQGDPSGALRPEPEAVNHERAYLSVVAELQELARRAPHVTQDWVLQVASMDAMDMRRRLIRSSDWHGHFAHSLDGIPEIQALPGAGIDGCRSHKEVRAVVLGLLQRIERREPPQASGERGD
ncbi:hypothetical protein [Methylibium sp. T29]|uniref:hypothetical protein n=1 Tax=Methylibium sp. T29 TaxID=1430884 RepID=UPI0003F4546B|nr:hypothetical protein [Methylibium sp. T29]EWS54330.1 hypothetical protein X551_02871 [Methylibium sp. T29]